MLPRVASDVGNHGSSRGLTFEDRSFTMNTIRGDKEIRVEFQPQLFEPALWAQHLKDCDMRFVPPPTDGREEAPGAHPKLTPVSDE